MKIPGQVQHIASIPPVLAWRADCMHKYQYFSSIWFAHAQTFSISLCVSLILFLGDITDMLKSSLVRYVPVLNHLYSNYMYLFIMCIKCSLTIIDHAFQLFQLCEVTITLTPISPLSLSLSLLSLSFCLFFLFSLFFLSVCLSLYLSQEHLILK